MVSISIDVKELKELVSQIKLVEDKRAGVVGNYCLIRKGDRGECIISIANHVGIYTQKLQCEGPKEPFLAYLPTLKTITSQVKSGVCHIYPDKVVAGSVEVLKDATDKILVEDFPTGPAKGKHHVEFEVKDITVTRQVYFYTKEGSTVNYYKVDGIYFHLDSSVLDLVQTEGVRLVRVKVPVVSKEEQTVSFLCQQIICKFLVKQTGKVAISASDEVIEIRSVPPKWTYIFKNETENYPNYNSVLTRRESTAIVKLDVKQTIHKLSNCKDDVIVISIQNKQATASSKTTKLGVIGSERLGGQIEIGVSRERLAKLLSLVDANKPIIMYLTTPREPIFLIPEGSQFWIGLISPITL